MNERPADRRGMRVTSQQQPQPQPNPQLHHHHHHHQQYQQQSQQQQQVSSQEEARLIHSILEAKVALNKKIEDRNEDDISLIYELCSQVAGFAIFPPIVRRSLAAHVLFAVIEEAGNIIITDNEDMDSYCVLITGKCEQLDKSKTRVIRYYYVGDSFGYCEPTTARVRFEGYLRTMCERCAFLCVPRDDFFTILTDEAHFPIQEKVRLRDKTDRVVCVTHYKVNSTQASALCTDYISRYPNSCGSPIAKGHVIVKATEERLLSTLVDGSDAFDPEFVDDFLLTFRVFMRNDNYTEDQRLPPGMVKLCNNLQDWLNQSAYRDKVIKIVLTWLSSYYQDFEVNSSFSHSFFQKLESKLLRLNMEDQLHLFHITLSAKSRIRQITISKSSRGENLPFKISGGYDKNCGIFISDIDNARDSHHDTIARSRSSCTTDPSLLSTSLSILSIEDKHRVGQNNNTNNNNNRFPLLKLGDQILEVNNINFRVIKLADAQRMLNDATHLSMTLKYNPSEFYEMKALPEGKRKSSISSLNTINSTLENQDAIKSKLLSSSQHSILSSPTHQVNILRVFNAATNDSKYLLIHEETTAREVVMIAVKKFNLAKNQSQSHPNGDRTSSLDWALFEVSVVPEAKTIKQRRLPEQMSHLASRAPLRSRFYIKNSQSSNNQVSTRLDEGGDSLFNEITKDCPEDNNLINLDASLFAKELTLADLDKFRRIEPQQFVYDTFFEYSSPSQPSKVNQINHSSHRNEASNNHDNASISSSTDSSSQDHSDKSTPIIPSDWMSEYIDFASVSNREMFWVVNEILREPKRDNRVKIIKKFILIAKECKRLKNFNSLFAIISGLGHGCVARLKRTFEKLDSGHKKLLDEMQAIFDPSKNMLNYRTRLSETQPPAIPLFPQIKKDFTFIKENPTYVKESNSFNEEELEDRFHAIVRNNHDNTNQGFNPVDQYSVLINFDKMRLVAKQIRQVTYYSSAPCSEYFLSDNKDYKKMHEEWIMRKRIQEYMKRRLNCDTHDVGKNQSNSSHITSRNNINYNKNGYQASDTVDSTSVDRPSKFNSSEQGIHSITYDERELLQLSLKIEPDASSHNNNYNSNNNDKLEKALKSEKVGMPPPVSSAPSMNSVNTATSSDNGQPSPTLSKSSSLSSCSSFSSPSAQVRHHHFHIPSYVFPTRTGQINPGMLKFGADSPDKVRKLQSLSEEGFRMKTSSSSSSLLHHQLRQSNDGDGNNQRHSSHILPTQMGSSRLTHSISQDLTHQRRSSAESSAIGATTSQQTQQQNNQKAMIEYQCAPHHKLHNDPIKLDPPPPPKNKQAQLWSQTQQHKLHQSPNISPVPPQPSPQQQPPPPLPPSISPIKPPIAPARSCSSSPNPNQPLIRQHLVQHHNSSSPLPPPPPSLPPPPPPSSSISALPPPITGELPPKPLPNLPQKVKSLQKQLQPKEPPLRSKATSRSIVQPPPHAVPAPTTAIIATGTLNQSELVNLQKDVQTTNSDNRGFFHAQPQYYAARAARTKSTNQQQCYHAAYKRHMDDEDCADSDSYSDEGDDGNTNLTSVV